MSCQCFGCPDAHSTIASICGDKFSHFSAIYYERNPECPRQRSTYRQHLMGARQRLLMDSFFPCLTHTRIVAGTTQIASPRPLIFIAFYYNKRR